MQLRANGRIGKHRAGIAIELPHDRVGRTGRRHQPEPAVADHAGMALLGEGRRVRIHRAALFRRDRQHPQLAGLDKGQRGGDRGDRRIDTPRQQFGIGGGIALVMHGQRLEARLPGKQLTGQMRPRADAGRRERDAVLLLARQLDEVRQRAGGRGRVDDQEDRPDHARADRLEVLGDVVALLQPGRGIDCERRGGPQQRVAVRRGMRDQFVGDAGAGARPVLDDELLPVLVAQRVGQHAGRGVVGPAGAIGRDQLDRARRVVVGVGQRAEREADGKQYAGQQVPDNPAATTEVGTHHGGPPQPIRRTGGMTYLPAIKAGLG